MAKPLISIITVTYNSGGKITAYLESIKKYVKIPFELIIVDNNSQDNTLEIIKKFPLPIKLLPQSTNSGFSKGNNIGAQEAEGEYLLFLNPDTHLKDQSLEKAIEFLQNTEDAGIVAAQLIEENGHIQPSVRNLPTLWRAITEYYFNQKNSYAEYVPKGDQPVAVETVVGAGMLIKKSLFERIGRWDERFFLYFEDIDLCKRVLEARLKVYYFPEFKVSHAVGDSAKSNPRSLQLLYQSAMVYHGRIKYYLLYLILWCRRFVTTR